MSTLFATSETLPFPESLTESYKPRAIADFVGLAKHKAILTKLAANPPQTCGLLFVGSPGTGKTSMAYAFAAAVKGEIHHIPSQDCKLETLQSVSAMCHRVPYNCQTGQVCKFHIVIIDEGDLMSCAGQNYLLSKLDGSEACPTTVWIITANSIDKFEDRFLSRLIQLPKFNGYGSGEDIRGLLSRIWKDRAAGAPEPDYSRVPTSNVREALQWLEVELLSA
jgi:replication-associated recombination protein RarA